MPAGFVESKNDLGEMTSFGFFKTPEFKGDFLGGFGFPYCLPLFGGIQAKWQFLDFSKPELIQGEFFGGWEAPSRNFVYKTKDIYTYDRGFRYTDTP